MADPKRKRADERPDEEDEKPLGRDDRVSLHPLSFEDAVRALYKTPAVRRQEKPEHGDD